MENKNKIQKIEKFEKENNNIALKRIQSQLDLLLEGQEMNQKELRLGFIGLAKQNQELVELNKQLTQQLETVVEELNQFKKERQEKAARKEIHVNRKHLPKRDPMTAEIYKELIKEAEGPTCLNIRLRIALCLLAVTGVHINELLNIKVS